MSVRAHLPGYGLTRVFRDTATRTGIYVGVALSLVFTTWLFLANRVPALERVALERNLIASVILGLIAAIPVLRFFRLPGNLLASSLIAWTIFILTYRVLCVHFQALSERYSAIHLFMLGVLVYLILTTLSWIGTSLWRASHASHSNHHLG